MHLHAEEESHWDPEHSDTIWKDSTGELSVSVGWQSLPNHLLPADSCQLILDKIGWWKSENRCKCFVLLRGSEFDDQIRRCRADYGKYEVRSGEKKEKVTSWGKIIRLNLRIYRRLLVDKAYKTFFKCKQWAEDPQDSDNEDE